MHVWLWFCDLASTCGHGMGGREPITYAEMRSWSEMTGTAPTPEEIELIRLADRIVRNTRDEEPRDG